MRKLILLVFLVSLLLSAQSVASIQGLVTDAKTNKPIPAANVIASGARAGLSLHTKTGGNGAFRIAGLAAGKYTLCVQVVSDQYLDPCQWNGNPTVLNLIAGQSAAGISLKLNAASVLTVQVQDPQKALTQKTKDGRHPTPPACRSRPIPASRLFSMPPPIRIPRALRLPYWGCCPEERRNLCGSTPCLRSPSAVSSWLARCLPRTHSRHRATSGSGPHHLPYDFIFWMVIPIHPTMP